MGEITLNCGCEWRLICFEWNKEMINLSDELHSSHHVMWSPYFIPLLWIQRNMHSPGRDDLIAPSHYQLYKFTNFHKFANAFKLATRKIFFCHQDFVKDKCNEIIRFSNYIFTTGFLLFILDKGFIITHGQPTKHFPLLHWHSALYFSA